MTRVVLAVSSSEWSRSSEAYKRAVAWLKERGYDAALVEQAAGPNDPAVTATVPTGLDGRTMAKVAKDVILSFLRNGPRPDSVAWLDTSGSDLGSGATEWPDRPA